MTLRRKSDAVGLAAGLIVFALSGAIAARGMVVGEAGLFVAINSLTDWLYYVIWPLMQFGVFLTIPILVVIAATVNDGVPTQGSRPQTPATSSTARSVGRPHVQSHRPRRMKTQAGAPKSASTSAATTAIKLMNQVTRTRRIGDRPKKALRMRTPNDNSGRGRIADSDAFCVFSTRSGPLMDMAARFDDFMDPLPSA